MLPPEATGLPQFWWEMLPAVPVRKDSHAYRRLKRSWFDHTCSTLPFFSPRQENHLTATLFENFVVLESVQWVPALVRRAGIDWPVDTLTEWNWGYEAQDHKTTKMADVAIHGRSQTGDCIILVEAKAKKGPLKSTDSDPNSYLGLEEFSWAPDRRLLYVVDAVDKEKTAHLLQEYGSRTGLLTWQEIGGLQIELALQLDCAKEIREFVAGAIQYQFLNHGIVPTRLVADYLMTEPTRAQINKANPEKMTSWSTSWRIDPPQ